MNTQSEILQRALAGDPLDDVLIIDVHVHWGKWLTMHLPAAEEGIVDAIRRSGVSKACINGILNPDVAQGNDQVAAAVRRHPDDLIGFAALNPYQPRPMVDELRRCIEELGMRGLKVHQMVAAPGYTPFPIDPLDEQWTKVWAYLNEHELPVLWHGVVSEEVIASFPRVPFMMAHGSSSPGTFRKMAHYPNFHIETASTQNTRWYLAEAIEALGPTRVLWGTDAPLDDFAHRWGFVLDSDLSEDEQRLVLGGNAARLLKL